MNIRYDFNDQHTLRLSASKSYTLPRFKERSPYVYVDLDFSSAGTPEIKHSEVKNFDLKCDWYISPSELFSVNIFYKDYQRSYQQDIQGRISSSSRILQSCRTG